MSAVRKPFAAARPGRIACAALAVLLTGCAVGPDFRPPDSPAETTYLAGRGPNSANGDAVAGRKIDHGGDLPAEWWEVFRSQKLSDLVRDGLANNADVGAAEAALRVAQANARAQRGVLFPVVGAGFDANRQKISNITTSNVTSNADLYSLHTAQVTVSFVPDIWGGTRRQIESANAIAEMGEENATDGAYQVPRREDAEHLQLGEPFGCVGRKEPRGKQFREEHRHDEIVVLQRSA